ncbi:MAG: hypothetical protein Q8Q09_11260 [Deltaproteobacteria bacterium]|nr:hypothetical protein [Deltaproteobacteria bacterium]
MVARVSHSSSERRVRAAVERRSPGACRFVSVCGYALFAVVPADELAVDL